MSPFVSEAQRKAMWVKNPRLAKEWTEKYGSKPINKKQSYNQNKESSINKTFKI